MQVHSKPTVQPYKYQIIPEPELVNPENPLPILPSELISNICFRMGGMEHPTARIMKTLKTSVLQYEKSMYNKAVTEHPPYDPDFHQDMTQEEFMEDRLNDACYFACSNTNVIVRGNIGKQILSTYTELFPWL